MYNDFKNWVESVLGQGLVYLQGRWQETGSSATARYCVIQGAGGPGPDVDDRYPRYRVVILGSRNNASPAQINGAMAAAESLIAAGMGDSVPCGAAAVRAIGEVTGPAFTTENRVWCQVDFEVTY